ncbi:MAG: FGGY family carbohydrate kinase [Dehalococcoidia bacterium]
MPGLVAGIESSARFTRVLVIDPADGRVVASTRANHAVRSAARLREGDIDSWWQALAEAVQETRWAGDIAAVSVAAPQGGLVLLDGLGRALRPAILGDDRRAAREATELTKELGGPAWWAEATGSVPRAASPIAIWSWLVRAEPELLGRLRAVRLPHDVLVERLTGEGVTDRATASGSGWWSAAGGYIEEVLAHVGLREDILPRVLGPRDLAGEITSRAADDTGLRRGTLVAPGTGSPMAEALALGLDFGTIAVRIDDDASVFTVAAEGASDSSGMSQGLADATGRFLGTATTAHAGQAVERVADWLRVPVDTVAERTDVTILPNLDVGGDPWLEGAPAVIAGLRYETSAPEILLGAYEGVAATLLELIDAISRQGTRVDASAPLVLIGAGARSEVWKRTVARLSGRALVIPQATELAALGAAVQAAALLGNESFAAVAKRWETRRGTVVRAVARDEVAIGRIRAVRGQLRGTGRA